MTLPPPERPEYAQDADERTMVLGLLQFHRDVLRRKTAGLDAEQLQRTLPPSDLTLGGMLRHMSYVEDWWFGQVLSGAPAQPPFDDVDWDADGDWDWHSAAGLDPVALREELDRTTDRSDALIAAVPSLDAVAARRSRPAGRPITLRWLLLHLVQEYARHNGHADLLRQSIDGDVGV